MDHVRRADMLGHRPGRLVFLRLRRRKREKEVKMRRVFLSAAIACLLASNAWAGVTCQRYGNSTVCSDNSGNSVVCQRYGNSTVCN
jgi:hypothetical protein